MSVLPYSYHTFLFPFVWNNKGEYSEISSFERCLDKEFWKNEDWNENKIPGSVKQEKRAPNVPEDIKAANTSDNVNNYNDANNAFFNDYAAYEYFMPNARNLLYNCDKGSNVVTNYEFVPHGRKIYIDADGHSNVQYIIHKNVCGYAENKCIYTHTEKYVLQVNGIHLRIFNSGVAMLRFETEYHGEKYSDDTLQSSFRIDDFNKINEYGRRINLPYIGGCTSDGEHANHALVADKLELRFAESLGMPAPVITENFEKTILKWNKAKKDTNPPETLNLTYICDTIKHIICCGKPELDITSKKDKYDKTKNMYIYPIIDDRMFVCAVLCDTDISYYIKALSRDETDYAIYTDSKASQMIYKAGFIDVGSCSCSNFAMRKDILKRCVYDRWIDDGTIDIITHHSMIRITGNQKDTPFPILSTVINPFLIQYMQMAEIALAQRATLLALFDRVDNATANINDDKFTMTDYITIQGIQKDYVKAQNQIFLGDVTVQEQGVEEFRMLLNELYLDRTLAEFDEQIKDAYELADSYIDEKTNHQINLITKLGAGIAVSSIGIDLISMTSSEFPGILLQICNTIGSFAILAGIIITIYYWKNKNKK